MNLKLNTRARLGPAGGVAFLSLAMLSAPLASAQAPDGKQAAKGRGA
jgi:hypothetical protein